MPKPTAAEVADPNSVSAAKKRGRKPKAQPPVLAEVAVEPPPLALTEKELFRIRAYEAEYRRHNAEATVRAYEKQSLLRQLDPDNRLGLLDNAIRASSEQAALAQAQHRQALEDVQQRLGIKIEDYSYDSDTGKLSLHAVPTPAVPDPKE